MSAAAGLAVAVRRVFEPTGRPRFLAPEVVLRDAPVAVVFLGAELRAAVRRRDVARLRVLGAGVLGADDDSDMH